MARREIPSLDSFGDVVWYGFSLEKIIDVAIGHAEVCLIGLSGRLIEQVGCWRLLVKPGRGLEKLEQRPTLPFGKSAERQDIRSAVTELGEEAGDSLSGMVRADDEQGILAGEGILRHHARPCLRIPFSEISDALACCLEKLILNSVDSALHVENDGTVRVDELQCELGIRFIGLHRIGQAHRKELSLRAFSSRALDSKLAQSTGERGILSATNSENETGRAGALQVIEEKLHPKVHLFCRIDVRIDMKRVDYLLLY